MCVSDAIAVGWSAAKRAQVRPTDVPLVIGCGAIALSVIATLKRLGAGPILAADFVPSRRALALAMGADVVIDPAGGLALPGVAGRDRRLASRPTKNMMAAAGSSALRGDRVRRGTRRARLDHQRAASAAPASCRSAGRRRAITCSTLTAKRKGLNIQFGGGPLP